MKPGIELDILVANKVVGLRLGTDNCDHCKKHLSQGAIRGWCECCNRWNQFPEPYSTNIAAAMPLFDEEFGGCALTFQRIPESPSDPNGYWTAQIVGYFGDTFECEGKTLPHAICLAALAATRLDEKAPAVYGHVHKKVEDEA